MKPFSFRKKSTMLAVLCLGLFLVSITAAKADYGLTETAEKAGLSTDAKEIPVLVGTFLGTGLSLIAIMFFVLMVYGGFLWMFDLGSDERKKKGLHTITAAIVGMILVMSAYTIANFVFTTVAPPSATPGGTTGAGGVAGVCCVVNFSGGSGYMTWTTDEPTCQQECSSATDSCYIDEGIIVQDCHGTLP